ncbi:MAG: hypothetical protein IH808_12565 [Proteobacteria bacterium]|nr:hypothetical protein [Pseudomonadota bacterium]
MGIFDKACPQCTADNAAGAVRCACGFIFDTADANDLGPSPQETAEEERLFQEYLAARVAKAIEQTTVAVHAADVEPANERRAIEAIRAQAVVEKAKVELAAQRARAAKAAEAARKAELIVGAVPIETNKPVGGSPVAKFGVAEVVEDDRLYKDYLMARQAQATEKRKTSIHNPIASAKPTTINNAQIVHDKEKWKIKSGVGKDSSDIRVELPSTTTQPERYPKLKRPGHTQPPPKSEIMALYSLQVTCEKQLSKKSSAKNTRPVTTIWNRPRTLGVLMPAMKVGLSVAAKTAAKGTKIIGKGIAKLISKTIQATQHHARKEAIPTLHAEIDVHPGPVRSRHSHGAKVKRTTVHSDARAVHGDPQTRPRPSVIQKRGQQPRRRVASTKPEATPPTKKNGVVNRRVDTRLGASMPKKDPIQRLKTRPKLSDAVSKQTSIPGTAFRAAQADKIAKAVEVARAMEEPKTNRDAFHAAQAEKIEQALSTARVMQSLKAGRECPLCTGPLAADATDCACGWTASAGEFKMPGLELSERERIETVGIPEVMTCPVECPACTATVPAGVPHCGCGWVVPVGEREMPPLALSPDERSAIEDGENIKRG